jgi:hypothetical protein
MSANPLKIRGRHRVTNEYPKAEWETRLRWGNDMTEAYQGSTQATGRLAPA